MSTEHYPLTLIGGNLQAQHLNRVLVDEFESGVESRRLLWADRTARGQWQWSHTALTRQEVRVLEDFEGRMQGTYEPFWWRDNVGRSGNRQVRFVGPIQIGVENGARSAAVSVMEVAPRRRLPGLVEVAAAAGTSPSLWIDANAQVAYRHLSDWIYPTSLWDGVTEADLAEYQAGTFSLGASRDLAYNGLAWDGTAWARGTRPSGLGTGQPAVTLFGILRTPGSASREILMAVGVVGSGEAVGICKSAADKWEPYAGGASETWTGAQEDVTADQWVSVAVVWAASSNSATLYVDGVSIGSASVTRSLASGGYVSLGAAPDGTLKATGDVAHALAIPAALTAGQVGALHDLLAYQYSLPAAP